ncbi:MFS general substrate transporter [Agrocybe pediades]|nr:MFS general substrate transporter [Agrocybe pediades]
MAALVSRADSGSDLSPSLTKVELALSSSELWTSHLTNAQGQNLATQDEARTFLSLNGNVSHRIAPREDVLLLRKIDRHLMPIMFCIYFLQLMDKQTLSFSSVFGLAKDTDLVGDDYSLLGSIVFIAQLVMQPISAYLLVKFRLSLYVPVILGVFEASIQASFILTVQIWYRRQEQGIRLAVFYSGAGWVNIFGSLIMYGLGHINSNVMRPYQLVFLLLGGITLLVGFVSCDFKLKQVKETLLDIKSWCWMILAFIMAIPASGIASFGPLIIRGFGFDRYNVMLLMIPFGTLQIIFIVTAFWFNKKYSRKSPVILFGLLCSTVAAAILLVTGRAPKDQPILLLAYYMLSTFVFIPATVINWQSSNVAGHTKKSATTAFMLMGTFSGSIVGPLLFSTEEQPYYRKGVISMLACFSGCFVIVVGLLCYLMHLNERNKRRRIAKGKAAVIMDYSMLDARHIEEEKAKESSNATIGTHAFDDLTDLENDEFIVRIVLML